MQGRIVAGKKDQPLITNLAKKLHSRKLVQVFIEKELPLNMLIICASASFSKRVGSWMLSMLLCSGGGGGGGVLKPVHDEVQQPSQFARQQTSHSIINSYQLLFPLL